MKANRVFNVQFAMVLAISIFWTPNTQAKDEIDATGFRTELLELEALLENEQLQSADVDQRILEVSEGRNRALACIRKSEVALASLQKDRTDLGLDLSVPSQLASATRTELSTLESDVKQQQASIIDCQLLEKRAQSILDSLASYIGQDWEPSGTGISKIAYPIKLSILFAAY